MRQCQHNMGITSTLFPSDPNPLRITFHPTGLTNREPVKQEHDAGRETKNAQVRILESPGFITCQSGRMELQLEGAPLRTNAQPHTGLVLP